MHTAQAGMVLMGSSGGPLQDPQRGASIWEDFRDSMRELATDQVAAAIANGAFDEVDAQRTGRIQGDATSFRQCIVSSVDVISSCIGSLIHHGKWRALTSQSPAPFVFSCRTTV